MNRPPTRSQSVANDERAASPEVSSDYVIEQRKKKKFFYRVLGARVESYEVSNEANKCPAVQIQGQNFAENLMVAPKSKRVIGLTEEGLDDWFAQSQNRKIENLLLSKKEYFVPHLVSEGIRNRWSHKPRLFSIETSDLQEGHEKRFNSLYHDHARISPRSILQDPHKLLFEYAKLDPKPVVNGTVIRHQNAHVPVQLHNSPQKTALNNFLTGGAQARKKSSMHESPIKISRPETRDFSIDISSTEEKGPKLYLNQSMNTQSLPARKPSSLRSRAQSRTKATDFLGIPGSSQSSKKALPEESQTSLNNIKGIESRSDIKNTIDTQDDKRLPYYKNAADMLRDEELMKENEDFLQELIAKLHRKSVSKIEKTKSTEEDENKYNCDIRSQQIKFQRNVQQRLSEITDEQKKVISEYMNSSSGNLRNRPPLFNSPEKSSKNPGKKIASSESPQKVIVLFKGKRSDSVKPSSPEKITRATAERRKILQAKRSLNSTFDSGSQKTTTNFMGSPGYHSRYDSQPKAYRLSTEAKARMARRFLDNSYSAASSQSPRRISMSDTENQLRLRMEQEVNRKVLLALHRVDNQAVPIQFSSQTTENTPQPQIRELNLSIEPMNIEQTEETLPLDTAEEGGFLDFFKKRNEYIDPEQIAQVKPSGQEKITFWLTRGNLQITKGNFHNAIDCYKQVLLINSQQYVCIFNIGCMFERLENYEAAKKWLQLCYDLSFCREECLYGLALCAYKSGAPQQCHFYLQELSKLSDKENPNVNYLIALSCKETGKNTEAAKFYFKVFQEIQKNIGFDFAKKIFASLLLGAQDIPFKIDPREAKNFFDSSKEYLVSKPSTLVFEGMYTPENEWKPDLLEAVTEKLVDMKFWKRFSKEYLRTFLGYMHVEKFKTDTILFCPTDYVYIMASGSISFRDHSPGPLNPKIIATLEEGDIIGFSPIDNDIYKNIENWMICRSEVEVLAIRTTDFAQIWEAQKSVKKMIHTDIIEQTVLLRGITQQTLYTISYELAKKEVFRAGEVLYNDHSYMTAQDFNSKVKKKILNYKFYELIDKDDPTNQAYLKEMAARDDKTFRPRGNSRVNRKISFNKTIAQAKSKPSDSLRQSGPPRLEENVVRGMFIILSGECTVENGEKRVVTTLTRGDYFGENLLLGTVGHNNFGLIRCKTPEVEVLYIAKTLFNRIPKYDIERMIEVCSEVKRNKRRMNHLRPPSHGVL